MGLEPKNAAAARCESTIVTWENRRQIELKRPLAGVSSLRGLGRASHLRLLSSCLYRAGFGTRIGLGWPQYG